MISIRSRAVSWILTLTLVFTTMFGSTGMAFAETEGGENSNVEIEKIDETSDEVTGLNGSGTAEDPYLINNVDELIWFRDHVNTCAQDGSSQYNKKIIKLTANIDLKGINWEPIGSTTKDHGSFYGTFDGDGHTIYNLYVENAEGAAGFFAKVSGGGDGPRATVKNVTFENVTVKSANSYVGGVIGNAGGNSEIRNVHVTGDVNIEGYGYVGGVVGHGYPDMYDCSVKATGIIKANYWCCGALIGYAGEGGTIIEDCTVEGINEDEPLEVYSVYGGVGAAVGLLQYSNKCTNVSAANIKVKADSDYVVGYVFGNGEESTITGTSASNITFDVEGNDTPTITDAAAMIGNKIFGDVQSAFTAAKNGEEVKIFKSGVYALSTSGKDITVTGMVDGVVFDNIGAKNMGGADVTFNNVTFDYYPNQDYTGLQHSGNLTYNDCTFNGQVFLYGVSETFNSCTFNQDSADAYNVWTYGAKEVAFNDCVFNSVGKSVLIYSEETGLFNDVTVTGCAFKASAPVEGKAAIEMDSSLTAGINLTIDATTTVTGFGSGNVSDNSLWNNKKGNKGKNNDITVVVGENVVLAPNAPVIEGVEEGKTYYKEVAYRVADDTAIVTINDKQAALEGEITEAGTYTIVATDEVGYTTTVTFTIEAEHEYEWEFVAEINVEDIDFTNAEEVEKVLTHAKKCACGEVDETTVDLHDFEVEVTKEPTKEDPNGEATLFCATCGYEETKTFEEIADITAYLVAEYYDEAYAYAYAYADEEGYIDATIEGIDAVVAALDEALAVANESGMSDELKAELNAAYENVITTADQLKVLIETADILDDATYAEAVKLLAELEKNLNDFCSIMEQAGLDAADQLWIAYEYVKPIIIEQLKLAVEAGTAWLMDVLGELFDAFIAALPEIDKALYDWFYNNPEVVIGFFYEYGDEFGYLFDEYGDELACVLGYVLATYGPEAVEWALENPEEALAKWVEWYNKHGVRALAMIDKYIRTLDEMGAFDGIKASLKDFAAEVEAFIVDYAEKVVAALEAKYNELSDAAQAALAELKAAIESMDIEAILAAMEELEAEIAALYKDATTGDYIVTGDSYYVALGDTETEYAQIVADEMKLDGEQFVNAGIPGITAEELADLLASGEEDLIAEIAKADFITVGFSNNTITAYAKDQVADLMAKNAEEVDWDAVVGPNGAAAVEEALVDLEAALVAEGLGEAAEMVVTAVEAYAYACISFASNYPEVIDEIKAINADAEVVIVGMYNPFENAVLDVEGTQIPVGEFVGALVDLANIHYTAYAMLTGNATYVAAPAVETKAPFGEAMGIEEFVATLADLDAMEPSEAGNVYIAEQILKAMNVVDKDVYNFQKLIDEIAAFGEVTRDNLTDAKALAEAARAAWDALTDEEKALIGLDVYKVLVDFELEIAKVELGIAEDIEAAEKALAEAQAKAADIERALKITESTVTDLKAKVVNKSQIKVTWEAAEVTPDQYRVTLMRAGKKVGTYWVAGDKESVVLKNMLRGTNFKVRVTPVAKFEGKKYFSIYKTSNKVKTQLQKANLTVKKAGLKKQIISKDQNSTGFQIYISKDKNFKKDVKKLVYKTNKKGLNVKVKAKNFKKGANYVKVRAYTKVNGKTVYGAWSGTVKVVK